MGSPHSYSDDQITSAALAAGFMLSTAHGAELRKLMPATDLATLREFVKLLTGNQPEKYVEIGSLYRGRYSAIQFLQSAQSIPQLGAHGSLPVYMKVTGDDATNGRPTNV